MSAATRPRRIAAIHQPNFFPWLGYFDKIRQADVFVFLDRVNYPKSGKSMGSWCNRVQLSIDGRAEWFTCPVVRQSGVQLIDTVRIDHGRRAWRDELRHLLQRHYASAPSFHTAFGIVDDLLRFETDSLADFNINTIQALAHTLGYTTQFVRQSELPATAKTATARLVEICRAVDADAYLCGSGAGGYQDDTAFPEAGLALLPQAFEPSPYGDSDRFVPGLSVIDWLMQAAA